MSNLTHKQMVEFERFVDKEFKIVKKHFDRCMVRCFNKYFQLGERKNEKERH